MYFSMEERAMIMVIKAQYPLKWTVNRAKRRFREEGVKNIWSLLTA